jgi:hypothetical protein
MSASLIGGLIGARIGPLSQCCLDEALGLAVGARAVGPGIAMLESQASAQAAKAPGLVTGAVVGEHPPEANAEACVVAQCLEQGPAGALARLVRMERAEGHAGVIVNGHMDVFPAGARRVLTPVACDAVTGLAKAPELFDIQVQQITMGTSTLSRYGWLANWAIRGLWGNTLGGPDCETDRI